MFNFRLQSLLNYRIHLEEKITSEFANTKRQLNAEEAILKRLESERSNLVQKLNKIGDSELYLPDILSYYSYIKYINFKKRYQNEIIFRIRYELEKKRSELIDAIKKRKILELLREKEFKKYTTELITKEQKELDDLSSSRYTRKMKIEKIGNCL